MSENHNDAQTEPDSEVNADQSLPGTPPRPVPPPPAEQITERLSLPGSQRHPQETATQSIPRPAQPAPASPYSPPAQGYGSGRQAAPPYGTPADGTHPYATRPDATGPHPTQPHPVFGSPSGPAATVPGTPGDATPGGPSAKPQRPKKIWAAVVSTAAATSLIVGGGTTWAMSALMPDSASGTTGTSITSIGKNSPISVDAVAPASWEDVAATVAPSVVAIDVEMQSGEAQGSGVIYDTSGHIITNNHVVAGAVNDAVTVTLWDGRIFEAKIVGLDPSTDLAVIKLVDPPADITLAPWADSDSVVVGNAVMAVGNPLGLAHTVTTGIVSAVARPVSTANETDGSTVVTNAIQIDAAINPGNSGGPLFNAKGEVIGITSSIATLSSQSSQAGSIGLGFAIPSNLAKSVGGQIIGTGEAEHAFLGVSLGDGTATADGVTRRGAQVHEVTSGSPADKAGVKSGDVVVAIDNHAVTGWEFLTAAVRERVEGDTAALTLVREGQSQNVTVTLASRESTATTPEQPSQDPGQGSDDSDSQTDPNNQDGTGVEPDQDSGQNGGATPELGDMSREELFRWLQENL